MKEIKVFYIFYLFVYVHTEWVDETVDVPPGRKRGADTDVNERKNMIIYSINTKWLTGLSVNTKVPQVGVKYAGLDLCCLLLQGYNRAI